MTPSYAAKLAGLCTLGFLGVVSYLLASGHGLFWKPDGTALYYTYFAYMGEMFRQGLSAIAAGSLPQVPFYTFSDGYGADIMTTMGGNIVNPLNLIAVFFTPETAEYGYYLTVWIRVVLAGLAFSLYCFNRGKAESQTLVASLCYAFCGFMVFWGMLRHPGFMNMGILLPCLLLGADKVFAGERPYWLIVTVALSFFLSVYFTYMLCLCLLCYCAAKYFFAPRERSAADFSLLVLRFVAFLAIGFAIGALAGIPNILQMTSMGRVEQAATVPLLHPITYYLAAVTTMTGTYIGTRSLYIGMAGLLCVVFFLACGRRFDHDERKPWLVGIVALLVMVCIPWFGHAFNGFGYVTDRWMILVGFCVSYIVCLSVPALQGLDARDSRRVGAALGLILAFTVLATAVDSGIALAATAAIPAVLAAAILAAGKRRPATVPAVMACAILVGTAAAAAVHLSPLGDSYADEFAGFGEAYSIVYEDSPAKAVEEMPDARETRFSVPYITTARANNALIPQLMGLTFYSSAYSQPVDDLRDDMGLWGNHKNYLYGGNDGHLALDALSGAKYFVATDDQSWLVPYSYEKTGASSGGYAVYRSDLALPLAFALEDAIGKEDYDALGIGAKQEALLSGCVLEDAVIAEDVARIDSPAACPPMRMEADEGVFVGDGEIVVAKEGAGVTIDFEGLPESETYLEIEGLSFTGMSQNAAKELRGESADTGFKATLNEIIYRTPSMYTITASCDGHAKACNFNTPTSTTYVSRDRWSFNFGYSPQARTDMRITFAKAGTYRFDTLQVECLPVQGIAQKLEARQALAATGVELGTDVLTARFELDAPARYAVVTLPYSRGWTAEVDGEPVTVLRADEAFMAVPLEGAGAHEVRFSYSTPGIGLGAACSALGLAALVLIALLGRVTRARCRER